MTEFIKIAWRNLGRNPRRTIIITLAIAVGVWGVTVTMSIYNAFGLQMVDNFIFANLGHIQIHRVGYHKNPSLRLCMTDGAGVIEKIRGTPHMAGYAPRIYGFALAQSPRTSQGVMIVGIDPVKEPTVTRIKTFIKSGSYFTSDDEPAVLIGKALAHKLKLNAGDKLAFFMQSFSARQDVVESFRIKGIFASGVAEMDRGMVYLPLKQAERVMDMGGRLNEVAITVDNPKNLEALKAELKRRLPYQKPGLKVVPAQERVEGRTVSLLRIRTDMADRLIRAPEAIGETFKINPNVVLTSYRLELPVTAVVERKGGKRLLELQAIGVEPISENRLSAIFDQVNIPTDSWLAGTEKEKELEANQGWVILGEGAASQLGVAVGDTIVLESLGKSHPLGIAGTLEQTPVANENGLFAIAGRSELVEAFIGQSAATEVVVRLKEGADAGKTGQELLSGLGLEIMDWKELWPILAQMTSIMDKTNLVLLLCIYIIIAFGIANTMVMSVFERVRELGILKAIGTSPGQLFMMVIIESIMLALVGMALGGMVSGVTIAVWARRGLDFSRFAAGLEAYGVPTVVYPVLTLANIVTAVSTAFLIAVLSALYPALRASRLPVVQALRKI